MARDFNQNRIANARLVGADIDKFGKTFAIQSPWNADGFSSVNVTVEQAPSDIKQYLEGDSSITVYPVPSNVDKLCVGALMSFPNIEDLYLFKNDGVVSFETASTDLDQDTQDYLNDLNYLTNLKLIFVASDYVSSYSSYTIITSDYQSFTSVDDYVGKVVNTNLINDKYTTFTSVDDYLKSYVVYNGVMTYVTNDNKNDLGIVAGTTIAYFGASAYKVTNDNKNDLYIVSGVTVAYDRLVTNIVEDYTLTIPFVGDTTLTSEYVDSVIAMLSNAEKNAITKVVIPTDFSSSSANDIAWGYDFSALVNLNDNIWYGATQYDFSEYTIKDTTQDHILTASVVETELGKISSDKLTLIEKIIVPVDFTSYDSGSITAIQNSGLTNLRYLETTYSGGAMELDLQGDIVAKINDIGKTLDEALVKARSFSLSPYITNNDTSLIIIPPSTIVNGDGIGYDGKAFKSCSNLVYVDNITTNAIQMDEGLFDSCSNLIKIKNITFSGFDLNSSNRTLIKALNIKEIGLTYTGNTESQYSIGITGRAYYANPIAINKCLFNGWVSGFGFKTYAPANTTSLNEQAFIDLFNSLGTPIATKTITLNATDLAKLSNTTIQTLYNKNWQLSPTPSAFTFTIGSNTYSCDFGMTWTTWVASTYNTASFYISNNKVYDSNNNIVQLNGIDVADTDMIRYGDVYSV